MGMMPANTPPTRHGQLLISDVCNPLPTPIAKASCRGSKFPRSRNDRSRSDACLECAMPEFSPPHRVVSISACLLTIH